MGKKKSKIAKKKQSKASIASKRFGVSAKRGGGREKSSTSTMQIMAAVNSRGGNSSRHLRTSTTTTTTTARVTSISSSSSSASSKVQSSLESRATSYHKSGNRGIPIYNPKGAAKTQKELDKDFESQLQSMQEREAAAWNKLRQQSQSKKKKQKEMSGQQGQQKGHPFEFASPSFAVDDRDKSTDQLMDEAANQVGTVLGGIIGESTGQDYPRQSSSSLQAALSKQRIASYWKPASTSNSGGCGRSSHNQNSFSALQAFDDDDEDDRNTKQGTSSTQQPPLFNFAPASFLISNNVTNGISEPSGEFSGITATVAATNEAEFDPDL